MRGRALLSLFILLALIPRAAAGEEALWSRVYGGHGRDAITDLAAADGMLLATGFTTSTDGDLSARTREGKAGWLLGLDGEGKIVFSCCTAHEGRAEMSAPFAHEDGTFSCVLSGEGKGNEWLRVGGKGKIDARIEVSRASQFCAHTVSAAIKRLQPFEREGDAALLALIDHGDGTLCAAWMDEAGNVTPGDVFASGEMGCLAVGETGEAAWVAVQDGRVTITRLFGSGAPRTAVIREDGAEAVCDALMGSDGSVTLCGAEEGGGFLMRVSAEDETLFSLALPAQATACCSTETGFAIDVDGSRIAFVDEDGQWLETIEHALEPLIALAGMPGGVAVLSGVPREDEPTVAMFTQSVLSAEQSGREEGEESRAASDAPAPTESPAPSPTPVQTSEERTLSARGGMLRCKSDGRGVTVRMIGADGRERFSTRIPITTAADTLLWRTALLLDGGGVLLGGHYATLREGTTVTEGVTALLSADGVLRDIRMVEGARDVLEAAQGADGRVLLRVIGMDGVETSVSLAL
ncbi:MAG: hypothetical protein Q4G52_00085 [Clostridia bacterium]|nr:hypothetical protein [Clostridia bacterium]